MAHIAKVGSRRPKARAGLAAIYALLVCGAITTVYPFLLMVSTATKSQVDYNEFTFSSLIPRYARDDRALLVKYAEDRYASDLDALNAAHSADYARVADVALPTGGDTPQARALVADWQAFEATLPPAAQKAGFGEHDNAPSRLLLLYRDHLRQVFGNDIDALNRAWTEENAEFDNVTPPFERAALREWTPDTTSPKVRDWTQFKATLPREFLVTTTVDPLYRAYLRQNVYEDSLPRLNTAWHTAYTDWSQITLPPRFADTPAPARADWEAFVRTKFPLRMLVVGPDALPAYQKFLAVRGRAGAASAALPVGVPQTGDARTDWMDFVAHVAPVGSLVAASPENQWRDHLAQKYPTVAAANADFGTRWHSFADATPPQLLADWQFAQSHAAPLRGEWAGRNFRAVAGYIFLHGRAVGNTVLFCVFAIVAALIVNPMCAYALSRYPLPYAYQVLLFLLATMAFPAEVAMIPNFLLLKELGMLNTFWALVLPGLASGFSIFLLKGFFDSLPRELYEAGILDGATEITMFRRITIPLSLPIFSVIALGAFTTSYGAFLFALVTCQDPRMWTLMVWLYNLQDSAPQYVIMAALTLAALPTLLVFLLAQKVIMRGIILPSFK